MFDLVAFCRDKGIPYQTKGANIGHGWVGINCPFCGDDNFHGGYRAGAYTCWRCGSHSLFSLLKELTGEENYLIKKYFEMYNDESLSGAIQRRMPQATTISMPGDLNSKVAIKYLEKRRFNHVYLENKYGIRYTGTYGDFKYRIMIPVYQNFKLMTYQGRDYTDKQLIRYKTLSIEKSVKDAKHLLYNADFVKGNKVGVCEGVFDAIRLGDGFVATFGTRVTEEQIRLLSKYNEVYIVFDPEKEAQEIAQNVASRIAAFGTKVNIIDTELDHDPSDMSDEEVRQLRQYIGV